MNSVTSTLIGPTLIITKPLITHEARVKLFDNDFALSLSLENKLDYRLNF